MPPRPRLLCLVCLLLSLAGCGDPASSVSGSDAAGRQPHSPYVISECRLEVNLEPATHRLEAVAAIEVAIRDKAGRAAPAQLRLQLHRDLGIDAVTCHGAPISFRRLPEAAPPTIDAVDGQGG